MDKNNKTKYCRISNDSFKREAIVKFIKRE